MKIHLPRFRHLYQCIYIQKRFHPDHSKVASLSEFNLEVIRNFCIIAHIDHGKSTLADRLLEFSGTIRKSESNAQVLDKLSVERSRGITVKAQTAALFCPFENKTYLLNLLDTPGHVDFTYEVKRSIMACDNALLLVDACDGVMAQTLATFNLATSHGLNVIPILNKIDLPLAKPNAVKIQLKNLLGIDQNSVLMISSKFGTNIEDVITTLILDGKSPTESGSENVGAHCVIIDSEHHLFRGTVVTILVRGGILKIGMNLRILRTNNSYKIREIGIFNPGERPCDALYPGQVGYIAVGIHSPTEAITGDVFYEGPEQPPFPAPLDPAKPLVYAGLYPIDPIIDHLPLRTALDKLCLNDPSVERCAETHPAFGSGWRLGFLGLLHMDVFRQRLEEEHGANLILTAPSVPYRVRISGKKNIQSYGGEWITVHNAIVPEDVICEYEEKHVQASIVIPEIHLSSVLKLCFEKRCKLLRQECLDDTRIHLVFDFPLSEIIVNFNDDLKTISSGFASFDFFEIGWQPAELTKLTVSLNEKVVDELTQFVPKTSFLARARQLADNLAIEIPRQQFLIRIKVMARGKSVAKADIKPYRKDVTAKLHAADPSRRNKLLQRQAEGKRRLRIIGEIELPKDLFIKILKKS